MPHEALHRVVWFNSEVAHRGLARAARAESGGADAAASIRPRRRAMRRAADARARFGGAPKRAMRRALFGARRAAAPPRARAADGPVEGEEAVFVDAADAAAAAAGARPPPPLVQLALVVDATASQWSR